ncbi:MAG: ATP-binding protein, partial [Thermoanaerobaculaceae bacterium]|nr:ATP-binding protein [Thermoanaerobaculaceae bacterium]
MHGKPSRGAWWAVGAAALLLAGPSGALDPAKTIDQYPRDVWSVEQGLPQNSIEAIVQDRDGYLWLGTQEGLVRFDGVSFRVFDRATTPELGENVVASLAAGEGGSLWVGTTRALCRLKAGVATRGFGPAEGLPGRGVRTVLPIEPDEVWLGTRGGGIAILREGAMRVLSTTDGLAHDGVWWLARDREGAVWAGTAGGVSRVKGATVTSFGREHGLPGLEVRAVCVRRDGSVWVGTDQGVARLEGGRFVTVLDRDRMAGAAVYSMLEDAQGSLWIASYGAGLFRLVGDRLDRVTEKDGFPGDVVRSLYEDREGSLWVGLAGRGLVRLKDASFTTVQARHGLTHDYVTSVLEDGTGTLWVGTFGGGIARLQDGRWSPFNPGGRLPSENVWSLARDRSGALWVGTLGAGLAVVRGSDVRLLSSRNGLSNDSVRAILEDRQGSVWVATRNGLNRVRGDQVTVFGTAQGLSSDSFYCLHEDRQGRLWLGTSGGGVCRLDDGKAVTFGPGGLSAGTVYDILEDDDGTMWFGTAGAGIGRLRDGRWSSATTREGLFDNTAYRLLRDAEGFAWVSCNKGIFRVSLGELGEVVDGRRPRVSCMVFGTGDGLASAEANGGSQPAGWRSGDGRLWFPTIRGLAVVDPARLVRSAAPPPVRIEELVAAGESFAAVAPVRLGPGRNDLEIRYSGLEFRAPARVRFRYRLEGFDRDWVEAGSRRVAYYTNLPPGSYRFLVAAASEDGTWSAEPAALRLTLTPPVWATWWFRLGGLLVLAVLSVGWYRVRVHNFERERRVLERVVAERTAELAASRDQLAARSAQLEEINEIVKAINSRHALGELLGSILAQMRLVQGVDRAAALIWDREAEVYRFQASWGFPPGVLDQVELTAAETVARYESGATEVSPDIFVAPNRDRQEANDTPPAEADWRSMLVLRMRAEERVEGYLVLESSADEDAFAERDLLLLESLREHILSAFIKSRMLAELQALNEKKNEFLGMAAHDLRSPLGLISGWTSIVMRSLESGRFTADRAVRELGRVVSVSEHLTHLVTELLDLSAIESGKLRVTPIAVDVQAVLDDSQQLFARLAADKGIALTLRAPDGPCVALADQARLIEVVTNLLSNAIKFTPAGGSVTLRCEAGPGEVVTHVEDSGPGLSDEDLRAVFKRFGRLSARPTAGESSTGLGLAIVKKIVDAHGGRV